MDNHNRKGTAALYYVVGLATLFYCILIPSLSLAKRQSTYKTAENYAVQEFGDHKIPFTKSERKEWEKSIGYDSCTRNSSKTKTLENYISKASTRPSCTSEPSR